MLGQASEAALDAVRTLFDRYLPCEKDELESLISLGQLEMRVRVNVTDERFPPRKRGTA